METHLERMLAVICMTVLFAVMGGTGGTQETTTENYTDGWSITFTKKELTSEAGLCIVIPCSFTHSATFKPTSAIWFKCESKKCGDTDINDVIFNSNKNKRPLFSFRKRVALLEPSFTHRNDCSITINDLTESDTGSYRFRVEGPSANKPAGDGYVFALKKTLMVTSLKQKPQVNVPPALTEGQQTTLTCTAPGLCSGTPPNITWTWRKTGHKDSLITSNDTILKTENHIRVSQGHSSNLTFTPSSEHDGSEVTCQVTFKGNITAMETVTLNVTLTVPPVSTAFTSPVWLWLIVGLVAVILLTILLILLCRYRTSSKDPCCCACRHAQSHGTNQGSASNQRTNQSGAPDDVYLPLQHTDRSVYGVIQHSDYENDPDYIVPIPYPATNQDSAADHGTNQTGAANDLYCPLQHGDTSDYEEPNGPDEDYENGDTSDYEEPNGPDEDYENGGMGGELSE